MRSCSTRELRSRSTWTSTASRSGGPSHDHLDIRYLVVAADPEALRHDPSESLGARWLGWDEALALVGDASLRRLLGKARGRTRPPRT